MSKRITLSSGELRILEKVLLAVLKKDSYHIENSTVGEIGKREIDNLLGKFQEGQRL